MAQASISNAPSAPAGVSEDLTATLERPALRRADIEASDTAGASGFRDPNDEASMQLSVKLLREILDYQRRLNMLVQRADPAQCYLIAAYRKSIRVRRQLLRDLPAAPACAEL